MGAKTNRLARLWVIPFLSTASLATAAGPDLRLVEAAAQQDKAAVRALLKDHVDVNAPRGDGSTALLWAAHWNDLDMVDQLLRLGAKVNAADDHGVTPLAQACENANLALVERLLRAKADPNVAQTSGLTPLMIAAKTGNEQVVKALLTRGANVNAATTITKDTALMWAISERHRSTARMLVEGGADVHGSSMRGFTPLFFAARNGDTEMAKALIEAGVNVNETGADGTHVLPFAIISGQVDFAMFLLEQGADPNGQIGGARALHTAVGGVDPWLVDWFARHGNAGRGSGGAAGSFNDNGLDPSRKLALVKALLARGADPNGRITTSAMLMNYIGHPTKGAFEPFACGTGDLRGATPLWVAAYAGNGGGGGAFGAEPQTRGEGSAGIVKALLAAGADQRLTTDDGTTPFMVAAGLGRSTYTPRRPRGVRSPSAEETVKVLLEAGADINAVNEADFTALHGAAMRGLNEVVQFLVERGANINARDYRGRTAYRMAEGSKQSFQFQDWPETAALLKNLGADTRLGIPGTVQERLRDAGVADARQ